MNSAKLLHSNCRRKYLNGTQIDVSIKREFRLGRSSSSHPANTALSPPVTNSATPYMMTQKRKSRLKPCFLRLVAVFIVSYRLLTSKILARETFSAFCAAREI